MTFDDVVQWFDDHVGDTAAVEVKSSADGTDGNALVRLTGAIGRPEPKTGSVSAVWSVVLGAEDANRIYLDRERFESAGDRGDRALMLCAGGLTFTIANLSWPSGHRSRG